MNSKGILDFDEEAHKLFAKLNLEVSQGKSRWGDPVSPIYRHSVGNGIIYVGNQNAAENLKYLKENNITHVVNCTYGSSAIPNYHEKAGIKYYQFPISNWFEFVNATNASVMLFCDGLFTFVDNAISSNQNVLVHCLAGAHRAGTTGCLLLMHYCDMDVETSIRTAKTLRPIIDPIGQLPEFLRRFQRSKIAAMEKIQTSLKREETK